MPLLQSLRHLGDAGGMGYGYSHLFITYENGIVKRGLYGELLRSIPHIGANTAQWIGYASVAIAAALAYAAFARRTFMSFEGALLLAFLLSGCGVLPHLAFISGFLDVQLFIVAMANIVLIGIARRAAHQIVATTLLSCVGLLIHEAYVLLFYPAVLMIVLAQQPERRFAGLPFWLGQAVVMVVFLSVVLLGKSALGPEQALSRAALRTDMQLMPEVFQVLTYDAAQQWASLRTQYKLRDLAGMAATLVTALPYLIALWIIVRRVFAKTAFVDVLPLPAALARSLIGALAFAPLVLVFFGHDVMRWISAACINGSLFAAFRLNRGLEEGESHRLVSSLVREPWFVASFLWTLVLGPFGAVAGNRVVAKLATLAGL